MESKFDPKSSRSLFVVGDDAQSIYAFRGSKIEIILGFHKLFKGAKEIILNQNYRSSQNILDLAEQVLTHNPKQKKKELFTDKTDKIDIKYYEARNEKDEAEYIIRELKKRFITEENDEEIEEDSFEITKKNVTNFFDDDTIDLETDEGPRTNDPVSSMFDVYDAELSGKSFLSFESTNKYAPSDWSFKKEDWSEVEGLNDCAVLYRTHAQSRAIEEAFLKHGLPYKLVSGTKFLDRKEIKDVLSILKFASNNEDRISFARFFVQVTEGIGPKTLNKIILLLEGEDIEISEKAKVQLDEVMKGINECLEGHDSLIEFTKDIIEASGYINYLKKTYFSKEDYLARMENISELFSLMLRYDEDDKLSLQDKLNSFLTQISLMTNQDEDEQENAPKISLMSLHQSKGLEYDTIFLVGVEDNLLPHSNSFNEPDGFEEEVRLAYVGVTRAKNHLHLINANSRVFFGDIQANQPSRIFRPFLKKYTKKIY